MAKLQSKRLHLISKPFPFEPEADPMPSAPERILKNLDAASQQWKTSSKKQTAIHGSSRKHSGIDSEPVSGLRRN